MIPRVQLSDGSEMPVIGLGIRELWNTCHRPERVVAACRSSLQNLGLDYLDLYLMHWPVAFQDGDEPFPRDADGRLLHEDADYLPAYREMEQCVRLGLARSIGLANFNSEQLARVLSVATIPPVNNQVECHPYLNQLTLAKFCAKRGVAVTCFSPLGAPSPVAGISGTPGLLGDARLRPLCAKYRKTPAQIVLRYLVQRGTYPLPKSQDKDHMIENTQIFDFDLSTGDMHDLDVFDSRMRFYPFIESKDDYNYPFGVDF
ncbi:aldo-keto reductase family 1 member A1-like isoform X2 [Bacillus rossius redtenbacheri]|uniref:aldo-keto reductase family 1 member A1-like isoform X2 n=1 Tax=Bacillus rossius redtenbacheri TaxID=93214 RepID=UPI002FDE6EFB